MLLFFNMMLSWGKYAPPRNAPHALWCIERTLFDNYRLSNWISAIEIQAGLPRVVLKFKKEMKMAVSEQSEEAWNKNDAVAWIALLHEDYQFKFHSNGKVMKKIWYDAWDDDRWYEKWERYKQALSIWEWWYLRDPLIQWLWKWR